MGWHNFRVWDLDIVETHNLPNQIYDSEHVGMKKVDAFEAVLKRFNSSVVIEKHPYFFEASHSDLLEDYVFLAVDTLSARKEILPCIKNNIDIEIAIETKMGFTHAELNILDPYNPEYIDKMISNMKDDSEVPDAPCNERIITTLTNVVASSVVHHFCSHASSLRREEAYDFSSPKTFYSLQQSLTTFKTG